jgi:hypothetical protein
MIIMFSFVNGLEVNEDQLPENVLVLDESTAA